MDHRSVAAAAAGGTIAIGPSPAPHRISAGGASAPGSATNIGGFHTNHHHQQPIIRSVAVPTTISEKQQNILRVSTKSTPWSGVAEFDSVGRGLHLATALFPPQSSLEDTSCDAASVAASAGGYKCCPLSPDERAELDFALRTVAVWRDRAEGGRLPHSVETSAALASALLEDANAHDLDGDAATYYECGYHGRPPSELSLRMSYSSAVVRATNGLADASVSNRGLKKPGYGMSVAALCERIGIPGWVVDMRHDAAHNELPSLPSLRLASKTLLGYLGDKYWSELVRLRGEAATKAVSILDEYKASAKAAAVEHAAKINQQIAKAEAARSSRSRVVKNRERREQERAEKTRQKKEGESGDDDDDDDDDFMEFGRFSIFAETSSTSSKKKGKKRPREESAAGSDDATTTLKNQDAKKDEPAATKDQTDDSNKDVTNKTNSKQKKKKLASPLHFASQFINEVSIDTGLQILLSYLVWGGVGDMPPEKGSLVPGSPATIPETEQGFDKVKHRYVLLLAKVSTAYTGFLQTLMVDLVDLILMIKERQIGNDGAAMDAGDERKLFFLNRWVKYLVSREFHSHFDPHLAVFPKGKVDLTRKRVWKWCDVEKAFMAECAPSEAIHRWQFPLNSLYERCNSSPCGYELTLLFKKAGGNQILHENTKIDSDTKTQADVEHKETGAKLNPQPAQEKSLPPSQLKDDTSGMSLAQMEALLSDSDTEDDHGDESKPEGATQAIDGGDDDNGLKEPAKNETVAWTLCKSWDTCAIGTLPGYPSFY